MLTASPSLSHATRRTPHAARFLVLFVLLLLFSTSSAFADTVRVFSDRALVWTRPSGVSVVITQLKKDDVVEVVRRTGDWYEVRLPSGTLGLETRTGYVLASQVVLDTLKAPSPPSQAARAATAREPQRSANKESFLNIDGVYRVGQDDLTRASKAFSDVLAEEGTITSNYGDNTGWSFEVMAGQAVWNSLGFGVGVGYYLRDRSVAVEAAVPHPFLFNRLRPATFDTEPLSAHEAAVHIPVVWMPAFGRVRLLAFAGPSIFRLSQVVVTGVTLNEAYPYDTVAISGVTIADRTATVFGYHAGGDVSYLFSRSLGLGAGVRYSRSQATIEFADDEDVTTVGIAGALQVVAGVRFRF